MDSLTKWSASVVDLLSLFSEWERRQRQGHPWTRRFREIHSICMFALLMENRTQQRYLVAFQHHGLPSKQLTVNDLFADGFGEIEDCDVLLVDDPKSDGEAEVLHHRCQLVSYLRQPSTSEADLIAFLESKKLCVPPDDDLRLIIHIEQEGRLNYQFLAIYLAHRPKKCPYSQVFAFGQNGVAPRKWFCVLVYPQLAIFPELDEEEAKSLILDRKQYNKPPSA